MAGSTRRKIAMFIFGTLAILMLCGAWFACWIGVPNLFPNWVVVHSPWMDPVIRACAAGDAGDEHIGMSRLASFGPAAVPNILPYLKHFDPTMRRVAATALGNIHDARGIDPLIDLVDDPDRTVRSAALRSVYRLSPSPQQRERMRQVQSH